MKTPLLLSFFFFTAQLLTAQYIPLPETTAKWSVHIDLWSNPNEVYLTKKSGFVHEMNGDTIINGLEYKKILQRQTWYKSDYFEETSDGILEEYIAYNIQADPVLIGVMRQDIAARKVYFRRLTPNLNNIFCAETILESDLPFDEDVLLYDFDMALGDTVYLGGNNDVVVIINIDSVMYNDGTYRKRYQPESSYPEYYFIEGIGTDVSLFAPLAEQFSEGNICSLKCFSIDDEYIIGNGIYNCDSIDMLSPIVEIDLETSIDIYPNPFGQYLEIGVNALDYKTFRTTILNSVGQQQTEDFVTSNEKTKIETEHFSPGIYFLAIYDGSTLISTQKVIKSN